MAPEIVEENKINNIDTFDNFQYADLLFYLLDDEVYIILNRYNNATFNVMFDLKEFPFDLQNFYFDFYTPALTYEIILEGWYDQENTLASREYFLSNYGHPEWQYTDITSFIESYEYTDGTYYDNFSYYVNCKKKYKLLYY